MVFVKNCQPIREEELVSKMSSQFNIKPHTAHEYIASLLSLRLIRKIGKTIVLTASAKEMLLAPSSFLLLLKRDLIADVSVVKILEAIDRLTHAKVKVKSTPDYYSKLSKTLTGEFGFPRASTRALDGLLSLFRAIGILDLDPFLDQYFRITRDNISDIELSAVLQKHYRDIVKRMFDTTGTSWIRIDQLRSKVCQETGVSTKTFDDYLKRAFGNPNFEFAGASTSRKEVRKGGIDMKGRMYFYFKITEGFNDRKQIPNL